MGASEVEFVDLTLRDVEVDGLLRFRNIDNAVLLFVESIKTVVTSHHRALWLVAWLGLITLCLFALSNFCGAIGKERSSQRLLGRHVWIGA